jgi:hypothetical protein
MLFNSFFTFRDAGTTSHNAFLNLIAMLVGVTAMVFSSMALAQTAYTKSAYAGLEDGNWGGKKGAVTGPADGTCAAMGAVGKLNLVSNFGFILPEEEGTEITGVKAFVKASEGTEQTIKVALWTVANVDPPSGPLGDERDFTVPGTGNDCSSTTVSSIDGGLDGWGLVQFELTPEIVNDPSFGMEFRKFESSNVKIDSICLQIDYTTEAGSQVTDSCFETPEDTTLTLRKSVDNDNGGTAVDTDWTLTATGQGAEGTYSGVEGDPDITNKVVSPGNYALTESVVDNYSPDTPGELTCAITGGGSLDGNILTLGEGDSANCTFFNTDDPPPAPPPSEGVPVPASNAWILGLLALLTLGIGWYFIPARGRRKV